MSAHAPRGALCCALSGRLSNIDVVQRRDRAAQKLLPHQNEAIPIRPIPELVEIGDKGVVPASAVDRAMKGAIAFELRQWILACLPPRQLTDVRKLRFARLRGGESCCERIELHPNRIELVQFAPGQRRDDDGSMSFEP